MLPAEMRPGMDRTIMRLIFTCCHPALEAQTARWCC